MEVMLVGCGAVAKKLYRGPLQSLEKKGIVRVRGLVDRDLEQARRMSAFFSHAEIYDHIGSALKFFEPGLTLVLSPAHLHAEHTIAALECKSHVLCEKPMSITEKSCNEMISRARDMDRVLSIGHVRRFFPSFVRLKKLLASEELGKIKFFEYREGMKFDWDVTTPAIFQSGSGGGILFDIGPHVIDSLAWFFDADKVLSTADDALNGVDVNVSMELASNTCHGKVFLSWDSPMPNELRVYGSKGVAVLRVDQFDKLAVNMGAGFEELVCDDFFPADLVRPSQRGISPRLYTQAIYCQLINIIRAIRLGEPPAASGAAGRQCIALIEAARRQAQPIDMTWLNPDRKTAFQKLHRANV